MTGSTVASTEEGFFEISDLERVELRRDGEIRSWVAKALTATLCLSTFVSTVGVMVDAAAPSDFVTVNAPLAALLFVTVNHLFFRGRRGNQTAKLLGDER